MNRIWAILPAAGSGSRLQSGIPKQYLSLRGKAILSHSLDRLLAVPGIAKVVVALAGDDGHWQKLGVNDCRVATCIGGPRRQDSVLNGLLQLAADAGDEDRVLVHDAARPCVRVADIEKLIAVASGHPVGGLLGWPVDNTLKRVNDAGDVTQTVDRTNCWHAATPQMFSLGLLKQALSGREADRVFTDEAAAVQGLGHRPVMVAGAADNIKITHARDLAWAEWILEQQESE